MSELIITSSAYIINGDSPMTSVANTVAMTTLAVHTLQPPIFYNYSLHRGLNIHTDTNKQSNNIIATQGWPQRPSHSSALRRAV